MSIPNFFNTDLFSLHPAQDNVWYDQRVYSYNPQYNITWYQVLDEAVDLSRLKQAWKKVVTDCDALRLDIQAQADGLPKQRVLPPEQIITEITALDFSGQVTDQAAQAWMRAQCEHVFDVERGERYQLALLKIESGRYYLFFCFHHLFIDAMCVCLICEQMLSAYQTLTAAAPSQMKALPDYRLVAEKAANYLLSNRYNRDQDYWQQFLQQHEMSRLPRLYLQQNQAHLFEVELSQQLTAELREFCQTHQTSLMGLLLSIVTLYFTRVLNSDELVVSSAVHGRRGKVGMQTVGMHSNLIVIATAVDEKRHFIDLLKQCNNQLRQGMRHSQFPYGHLSRITPNFRTDIQINYQFHPQSALGIKVDYLISASGSGPLNIRLIDFQDVDTLRLRMTYQDAYFNEIDIAQLCKRFMLLMEQCTQRPEDPLSYVDMLFEEEQHMLLLEWSQTDAPALENKEAQDKTLQQLFEEQVEKTPSNIALVFNDSSNNQFEDEQLTYQELNERANLLAHHIRAQYQEKHQQPLRPDTLIALYLDRSLEMIISILAVLKAGGAYVPISPEYPQERTLFMLNDTQASFVITQGHYQAQLNTWLDEAGIGCYPQDSSDLENNSHHQRCTIILSDSISSGISLSGDKWAIQPCTNPSLINHPTDLAYVIYTSGTTGKPKGVIIEHGSVLNTLLSMNSVYNITEKYRKISCFSHYTFDVSISEMFNSLCFGGELHLFSSNVRNNPDFLVDYIEQHQLNFVFVPPAVLAMMPQRELPSIQALIFAGEPCEPSACLYWAKHYALYNFYGPTETSIYASGKRVIERNLNEIGRSVDNGRLYVLSPMGSPVGIGTPGELFIGGAGLSRGYLNRPKLTAERFIDNPFATAADIEKGYTRLYKTGDIVRYLPDGDLVYLGRNDSQVKIHGHRIELGEIETALSRIDGVKQAVVIDRQHVNDSHSEYMSENRHYLAAYVVVETVNIDTKVFIKKVRQKLVIVLPGYMQPASFTLIERVPLTLNGKLDRQALPEPEFVDSDVYVAPCTEMEKQLCEIWHAVLGLERIGIHDNFFYIGGDSIAAIRLNAKGRQRANIDIPLAQLFAHPTIAELALELGTEALTIPRTGVNDETNDNSHILSFAQERLWFIEQFEGGSDIYHIPYLTRLQSATDTELLLQSINMIAARHPVLNSAYQEVSQAAGQETNHVASDTRTHLLNRPLSYQLNSLFNSAALEPAVKAEIATPFKLTEQAPIRLCLYELAPVSELSDNKQLGGSERYLLLMLHHIAFDGWSMEVFFNELIECYQSLMVGRAPNLPELSISYADFAYWQRDYLQGEVLDIQLNYWCEQLSNAETLNLTTDHVRPVKIDYQGADYSVSLDTTVSARLRTLAHTQNTTLYTVMLSGFYLLLSKLSNQQDIVIGTPSGNRQHAQTQSLIGFFVNVLALRVEVAPALSVKQFIKQVHVCVQGAKMHQELPFETLVSELGLERDMSRHPLFQVMFSVQKFGRDVVLQSSTLFTPVTFDNTPSVFSPAKYDLSLFVDDGGDELILQWNYALSLFTKDTIARFAQMYQKALTIMLEEPQILLGQVDLLSDEERYTLLHEWNQTEVPALDHKEAQDKTLQQLFEEQVEKTPSNIALVFNDSSNNQFEGEQLTYQELNERANLLAHHIRAQYQEKHQQPLRPDTLIALYLERSLELIISILAVLKAGGAYVPISPEYPADRTLFMLNDTQASFVITQGHYQAKLNAWLDEAGVDGQLEGSRNFEDNSYQRCTIVSSDSILSGSISSDDDEWTPLPCTNPSVINQAADLAYVIYTSGTTGQPKGVMIEHKAVINRLHWMQSQYPLMASDMVLQKTPYIFDVSVWELLWANQVGACVVVAAPELHTQPLVLNELIIKAKVTSLHFVPSMLNVFSQVLYSEGKTLPPSIKHVFCSGEALTAAHMDIFSKINIGNVQLSNLYGPTEAAIDVTYFDCSFAQGNGIPPIGKAMGNIKLYVLSDQLSPTPIGTPGELYIGGAGLARGYLNRPDLTAERFINNPFATADDIEKGYIRLYKTGDMVRYFPDGNLEFLGRNDSQVKIRGHRIELGEIEMALSKIAGVKQAVVINCQHVNDSHSEHKSDYHQYLAAYIVAETINIDTKIFIEELRQQLVITLPDYMQPSSFTFIENVPLTLNGKLDRKALPESELIDRDNYVMPCNEIEKQLCDIWQQVLGLKKIGTHDNFFHLGGNSIIAIRLIAIIKKEIHREVPVALLFSRPSIYLLSEALLDKESLLFLPLTPRSASNKKLFMIHPSIAGSEVYQGLAEQLKPQWQCFGVNNYNLIYEDKISDVKELAQRYVTEIVTQLSKNEPVVLFGWSMGGLIALEISHLLEDRGWQQVTLYLVDTHLMSSADNYSEKDVHEWERLHTLQIRQRLVNDGYGVDYIEKAIAIISIEREIMFSFANICLESTKVILFQAKFDLELKVNRNQFDLDCQIEAIRSCLSSDLKVVPIERCHHYNILNSKVISNYFLRE
ncbi:non-ribosomal peptide synthetase [Shewanella surugensis]|uniref:Amino acid adenylation domain-containing protein n=1 Tax=Shewanella surugensis TaxID=212020 RepID=A0ABT0LI25_9GAMM|nr:non-ribosomal peptide synthetase [Shewanella surugensis]MCL1127358.1 amino acid adenylation domain-containing protein [Shewanella surugensis]